MRWNWNPFKIEDGMTLWDLVKIQRNQALKEAVMLTSKRPGIERYLSKTEEGSWHRWLAVTKMRELNKRIDTLKANYNITEEEIETQAEIMRVQEIN